MDTLIKSNDMDKSKEIITECSVCKKRQKNWTYASPCCSGLSFIVDEKGNTTTRVFLSTLIKRKTL